MHSISSKYRKPKGRLNKRRAACIRNLEKGKSSAYNVSSDNKCDEISTEAVPSTSEECVNHVAKRLGAALRNKVKEWRSKGVTLGGRKQGSLTDATITKLQNFYWKAIVDNVPEVEKMKASIFATLFHCISTDAKPMHSKCPDGKLSWCFYNRAKADNKVPGSHKNTGDKGPVVSRPYRYDRVKQGIDYQINKVLRDGTICPINSPYASPVVLTRKKNDLPPASPEAYRFAIDYRKLNVITKYPQNPLPVIDYLLTNITHTGVMFTLDLKSGYFQLAISPKDIEKLLLLLERALLHSSGCRLAFRGWRRIFKKQST
ncbi:uncharacterized protein TNCV_2933881 [Trichonephila clavipes]|nr:uncharacterized protein TNCV_2933881 [Trichonephila clavipes]